MGLITSTRNCIGEYLFVSNGRGAALCGSLGLECGIARLWETDLERSGPPTTTVSRLLFPNEEVELTLHDRLGITADLQDTRDSLIVTSHRLISSTYKAGQHCMSIIPRGSVDGIEILEMQRPRERLLGGITLLAVGILFGWAVWAIVGLSLPALALGGIPTVISVWILASYAFPEDSSEIVVYAGSLALRHPLRTPQARCDAYRVAHTASNHLADRPPGWNWIA